MHLKLKYASYYFLGKDFIWRLLLSGQTHDKKFKTFLAWNFNKLSLSREREKEMIFFALNGVLSFPSTTSEVNVVQGANAYFDYYVSLILCEKAVTVICLYSFWKALRHSIINIWLNMAAYFWVRENR